MKGACLVITKQAPFVLKGTLRGNYHLARPSTAYCVDIPLISSAYFHQLTKELSRKVSPFLNIFPFGNDTD
jgi:hypothetical protein